MRTLILNLLQLIEYYIFRSAWYGLCAGNSMWASLRSWAISKAFDLCLCRGHISHSGLHTSIFSMDLFGQTTYIHRPRSSNRCWSWQILNLAYSCTISLCDSSVAGSLLADSEFDPSNAVKLNCSFVFPCPYLLGLCIQVGIRKCWSSISNWFIVLVECHCASSLCEVFFSLWKDPHLVLLKGCFPKYGRILPLCHPFCCHDLVFCHFRFPFLHKIRSLLSF